MSDIDGVFRADYRRSPAAANKPEQRIIQTKGRPAGTRVVQVERVTSGAAATPPKRDVTVRAAAWEGGFPAKTPTAGEPAPPPATQPAAAAETECAQRPARRSPAVPAR